ncbi:hypothetical protein A2837_00345 [Candidatus Kaiserbacteria bacterium RIFCSPHIGHO2_01_FULL_46_22]|uniref:Methenyltetrahydrofolate cyclohydrolase n=1 Tax=Candidatus Kaiserbacteria bacterium RIFCSPHIGHO2_01_FULL_46_22 TaxID=1798475 RepID=A0A1F6BXA9_9BACT|nr:MAG: hypothetical protein A2837_00345 [Candidatus Kaiserbacteria bacterium RIFCSPHIGHO2_01_FULL_46_22]
MLVDGKTIAADIYRELKEELSLRAKQPRLLVVTSEPNAETRKYLKLKSRRAEEQGVKVVVKEFLNEVNTETIKDFLIDSFADYDGVIIQLPLPTHIDTASLLSLLPAHLDIDVTQYAGEETEVLPPVIGAIKEIAKRHSVDFVGKNVVVVGSGRLVGKPAALWAAAQSAAVTVVDKDTPDAGHILKNADIIISGAGVPGLITPDQIKNDVVIFDAGTSEEGGVLKGDADPACAEKCSLFTPVPGGIGPVTIAILLRNLVQLSKSL